MSKLIINMADIQSIVASDYLNDVLDEAKRHLLAGGSVVIQEEYVNAPPDVIREFATIAEFESFIQSIAASSGASHRPE